VWHVMSDPKFYQPHAEDLRREAGEARLLRALKKLRRSRDAASRREA
jgi:hypothetical protein